MRLINTLDLSLHDFIDDHGIEYAIMSHRWYSAELTYQEMRSREFDKTKQASFDKIRRFCGIAKENGCVWAWADTCCIDKTSSAELQEAINSMWSWYRDALACYVYLNDVVHLTGKDLEGLDSGPEPNLLDPAFRELRNSEWFTRGWTLQELIAPISASFYNADWDLLGDKHRLARLIEDITSIPLLALQVPWFAREQTIAMRMSWAAKRRTTRKEDMAYSLMGLFDVNMPLLYGEGDKAYLRLQLEIMQKSDDQSIFAWTHPGNFRSGLLALHPDNFLNSGAVLSFAHADPSCSHRMTNKGLKLRLPLIGSPPVSCRPQVNEEASGGLMGRPPWPHLPPRPKRGDKIYLRLLCVLPTASGEETGPIYITLQYSDIDHDRGWKRVDCEHLRRLPLQLWPPRELPTNATVYIKQPGLHYSTS